MKLEVTNFKEESDGGATVELELDDKAKEMLISIGFNKLLLDAIMNIQLEEGFSQEDPTAEISDKNESILKNLKNYEEWRKDESKSN